MSLLYDPVNTISKKSFNDLDNDNNISVICNNSSLIISCEGMSYLEIFDLRGRQIEALPVTSSILINRARYNQNNGCYILRARTSSGVVTERFRVTY